MKAKRDLAAANAIKDDEYVANIVLYHSQQVVEKGLKALFEEHTVVIPRIHSLMRLFTELKSRSLIEDNFVPIKDLIYLDSVYLDSRYPGGLGLLPCGFPAIADAKLDLLIVLDKVESLSRDLEELIKCTYGIQLTSDRPLHLTPADEKSFTNGKSSLYRVVARDGVEV